MTASTPPRRRLSLRKVSPLLAIGFILLQLIYWNKPVTWNINSYNEDYNYNEDYDENNSFHLCIGEACTESFPPPVQLCNVSSLNFAQGKMHKTTMPHMFTTAKHPVAYGPFLTKCGSSSTVAMLKYFANETTPLGTPNQYNNDLKFIKSNFLEYKFISFVRHPLERALAGYSQIEVFYRRGWIQSLIQDYNLTWWNSSCIDTNFGISSSQQQQNQQEQLYQCTGTIPSRTTDAKLKRLYAFLVDIQHAGFYDQHVTPQTYLIATNPIHQLQSAQEETNHQSLYFFHLHDMNRVHRALCRVFDMPFVSAHFKDRTMGGTKQNDDTKDDPKGRHWQVQWDELKEWSSANITLAQDIIDKLCVLYRHDVECLPYDVPECNYG